MSDTLKAIAENTTHLVGYNGIVDYGMKPGKRWIDIIEPPPEQVEDTRSCDEIIDGIWANIEKR